MTSQNVDPAVSRTIERSAKETSSSNGVAVDGHAVTKRLQQDLMTLMVCSTDRENLLCIIRGIISMFPPVALQKWCDCTVFC